LEAYSLFEINQYIRRVIALNFEEALWVECEINQISQTRGNTYLELIEKNPENDDIIAKSSATLWFRQLSFIKKKLGKIAEEVLSPGIKVKLKCTVDFSERYGLSLNILDIDPAYTFGQFELNRQQIIERLQKEEKIEKNSLLDMPLVLKKIAVISSSTAAGFKDFSQHLYDNPYGYGFQINLFQAAMQGQNTEREVLMAFDSIDADYYDIICIIRGGGSKLDLSAFDNYAIASRISESSIPVFTGIGHEIDQSICDIVAHSSLKTPTAVAAFLVDHNATFESEVEYCFQEIAEIVKAKIVETRQSLASLQYELMGAPRRMINEKLSDLSYYVQSVRQSSKQILRIKKQELSSAEKLLEFVDPRKVLKRGYTLIQKDGKYITRKKLLKGSSDFTIQFFDGELKIKE